MLGQASDLKLDEVRKTIKMHDRNSIEAVPSFVLEVVLVRSGRETLFYA
jgi:hypothetical protein